MTRSVQLLASAALALAAAGCTIPTSGACQTDADCLNGGQCLDGICTGGETPTATITAPAEVALGTPVTLDGSGSTRADGSKDGLVYAWTVISPADVTLSGADAATASFDAAKPKETYRIQLVVFDHGTPSTAVVHEVKVANTKPVARIESAAAVWPRDTEVTVAGTASTDADGDALTYSWSLAKDPVDAGGALTPNGASAKIHTATTAVVYTVTLTVSDGALSDTTTLVRSIDNVPPTLSAEDDSIETGHACTGAAGAKSCEATGTVRLSTSDLDGTVNVDSLAFRLVSAPAAANATVTFTPVESQGLVTSFRIANAGSRPIAGDYELEASIADNDGAVTKQTFHAVVGNGAPAAGNAGASFDADHSYDASGTGAVVAEIDTAIVANDADGDDLTVTLGDPTQLDGTPLPQDSTVTFTGSTHATVRLGPSMYARVGQSGGAVRFTATLRDVNGGEARETFVLALRNRAPTATPPAPLSTAGHTYGTVNGRASSYYGIFTISAAIFVDPDGDPLTVQWAPATANEFVLEADRAGGAPATLTVSSTDKGIVARALQGRGTAADAFGGSVNGNVSFTMGNRPPAFNAGVTFAGATSPGHSYGAVGTTANQYYQQFDFTNAMGFTDPDGDPTTVTFAATATGAAPLVRIVGAESAPTGIVVYGAAATVVNRDVSVARTLSDGIGTAATTTQVFKLGNRAPTLTNLANAASITTPGHSYGVLAGAGSAPVYSGVLAFSPALTTADPDGDPLTLTWSATGTGATIGVIAAAGVPASVTVWSTAGAIVGNTNTLSATLTDGVAPQTATRGFVLGNRAPTVTAAGIGPANVVSTGAVSSCVACNRSATLCGATASVLAFSGSAFITTLSATATDPDGDPLTIRFPTSAGWNQFYAGTTLSCTSGVACPTAAAPLGVAIPVIGVNTCASGTTRRTVVETTSIDVTADDNLGALSPGVTKTITFGVDCSPSCQ